MLDELEEVDCGVEKRGLEVLFQVRVGVLGFDALDVLGDVDEGGNVHCKLSEDGADDVDVEDVVLGTLFREGFDGLKKCQEWTWLRLAEKHTFAREMDRKQTLIIIPEIVT